MSVCEAEVNRIIAIRYKAASQMAQVERPVTKPEDGQGGTKDGITDIACDSGDPSGMADRDPAFFYYDRRKRSGMDRHCDCADMHSEDPEMRSDHDNRHGNHLSCGKFVPEKCDRETPSLCCGPRWIPE